MDLSSFKITFDGILQTYVQGKIEQSHKLINDKKINTFIDYITTFIFSGGKRIRPYGLRITYTGFGGDNEKAILNFGIIFELLHSMALIHDDIIDQSEKRHNAATMHSYITTLLGNNPNAKHIAEGQAILLGDLLLSRVYELRYKQHDFQENLLWEARKNVHSMIEEVILGQMIDVDMMISGPASLSLIDKKNMYKTASYTFVRPMLTGAILAGASKEQQELIKELGKYMGMAFQMRDDYLDITFGDKTKSAFSDIQEGQQTYFTNYIFEKGTPEQQELLKSSMGKQLNEVQIKALQDMFEASGAIAFGKESIMEYSQKSREILDQTELNDEAKKGILVLIKKMEKVEH
ncbi:MAG: polyprenyl synthetase family protein [candidate division SR1 bacterium]|nr:polyprenyl synthetase family protein [candidate division SR1 bacterium]